MSTGRENEKSHTWANDAEGWNLPEDILQVFMMQTGTLNMKSHAWANDVEGWNLPEVILDFYIHLTTKTHGPGCIKQIVNKGRVLPKIPDWTIK